MDKQLQQRLLGAAVIVALVVIFVPELVKSPQDRLPESIAPERSELPPSTQPAEPITQREGDALIIGVPRPVDEAIPSVSAALDDDEPVVLVEELPLPFVDVPGETTAPTPESLAESTPTEPAIPPQSQAEAPSAEPPPPAQPEPPPPVRPEPPPPVRPEPPPPTPPEPPTPPRETASVQPTPPPAEAELPELRLISRPMAEYQARTEPTEQPRWVVQAGSFESAGNAGQLHDQLRAQQFPAILSQTTVDGRVLYRVQVGPHSSRAEGERMRDRLRRETGIEGSLIPVYN